MLKRTYYLTGSYILNQRVFPDWWQPYYREEVYRKAKARLDELYQIQGVHESRYDFSAPSRPSSLTSLTEMAKDDGMGSTPAADAMHDQSPDDMNDFDSNALPSSSSPLNLMLYEVNGLVGTFLASYNAEDLSATLRFIRERLGMEICSYHYNALFRIFNYGQDKESVMQLMDFIAQRGEMTLETYARAVDCIHCLAPADSLDRILTIVRLAQEAFGSLIFDELPGSEAATVGAYDKGLLDPPRATAAGEVQVRSCPVLTALLHHLSVINDTASPLAVLLVAVWVRALGVGLSDWDYVFIFTALLTRTETFPRVCRVYSGFSEFSTGEVSPRAVFERLQARREGVSPSSLIYRLMKAMRDSLEKAGVDLDKPVEVGVVNTKTIGMQSWFHKILKHVVFHEGGLGPRRYDAGVLYHILSLLYSTVRDDKSAADMLLLAMSDKEQFLERARREHTHQKGTECDTRGEMSGSPGAFCVPFASDDATREVVADEESGKEPFTVCFQHVQDVGSLLPRLSQCTRHGLHDAYKRLVQDVVRQYKEERAHRVRGAATPCEFTATDTSDTVAMDPSSFSSSAAVSQRGCMSLLSPPRPLSGSDIAGCEGYTLGVIQSTEEACKVLHRVVARMNPNKTRIPREIQLFMRQLAQYCSAHPLRNCKLTPTGLEERLRWGKYLDARDTALALFGSGRHAREYMKQLYYNGNRLLALRSEEVVMQDIAEVADIFFPANGNSDESSSSSSSFSSSFWRSCSASEVRQRISQRSTLPHIRCSSHLVPPYLYDPGVYNPYPHITLKISPIEMHREAQEAASKALDASDASSASDDLFAELWGVLMNPDIMGRDLWYLHNTNMYMSLMRCLLHRLDWEAAAHLTTKMQEHTTYTYLMDHELTTIFKEIGDPAGCLAFKVATGLFDGRITQDGQAKRKQFHES